METPTTRAASGEGGRNGTTDDQNGTTAADQTLARKEASGNSAAEEEERRRRYLEALHVKGGFLLSCRTLVTLHRVAMGTEGEGRSWEIVGGGILSIVSRRDDLSLVFSDPSSGEVTQEFSLRFSKLPYSSPSAHFHSFVAVGNGKEEVVHGMSFADVDVASKVLRVVCQLSGSDGVGGAVAGGNDDALPAAKRVKLDQGDKYSDWVVINREDVPAIGEASESAEGGREETDFSLFSKKKDKAKDFKIDDISGPSYFRHLTKTSDRTPNPAPSSREEGGTKRSSSVMEFITPLQPIPVEPPIAPSLSSTSSFSSSSGGLTGSSSFASSFSGSSLEVPPPPPPHDSDPENLILQINTFNRKKLHHVTRAEIAGGAVGEGESVLGSILRNGFDRMLPRLREKFGVATFASIGSEGEEEGFDDFDGTIFE